MKILVIKFKYLGDVLVMTPALRALKSHWPEAEIHALVAAEAAPLLEGHRHLAKVWALPRVRGQAKLASALPLIRQLRAERFARSVDLVGNDRGALLSLAVGARQRLGVRPQRGFRYRRLCYTESIEELDTTRHESVRDYYVLSPWQVPPPDNWELELARPAPTDSPAQGAILIHLTTSQPKKEWLLESWVEVGKQLVAKGHRVCFASGASPREQERLKALQAAWPTATTLPQQPSIQAYAAAICGARLLISPDTAPLHLAAALGLPTVGLFGPTSASRWGPLGDRHRALSGAQCPCSGHLTTCLQAKPCIHAITVEQVLAAVGSLLESEQTKTTGAVPSPSLD